MPPSPLPASQPRLSPKLIHLLGKLSLMPVNYPHPHGPFAVADTGATDHMIPDKSCFISYKSVSGLSVCMGNNSFVPVLGRGTAIFSLNGKRVLVQNVLHVPGLAVPLYSLRTHVTQRGCGFIGTESRGFSSTSNCSFFRLTWPSTAICLSHHSGTLLHSIPSIMYNRDALQLRIPLRILRRCLRLPHHRCCPWSWRTMQTTLRPPHHPPLRPLIRSTTILST